MDSAQRADAAERAITERHLRRLWGIPGTVLGRSAWPPRAGDRVHWHWNYWWQAHLLDCLVDAQLRRPDPARARTIERFARTIRLRNFGRWTNDFYDDMAWLGLALHRAGLEPDAVGTLVDDLRGGWTDDAGGGIWWRKGDRFKNVPANGPAAILHARVGEREHAARLLVWMEERLVDPDSGIVWDGLRVDTGELVALVYTYCQGVFLGACLELSEVDAAVRTVHAVADRCTVDGVLRGQGGGDGGLFAGILARYLALAAVELPGDAAGVARQLVLDSADACWEGASEGPLFSPEWTEPSPGTPPPPGHVARDLSVQLGGWMLLEAAASLSRED
ncbi:glycoside hydrolase family 76 protein [Amycolatopsis suaedae]|uniref:Fructose-bisphosphate aldolase n=1 Tax=Amycolatopsis suaedae TaxID=2510978 RepID=A0A4Q7JBK1_9PSEU|nr:glycoside hydrolase family 76 protein [Amycolatopsis suaedae]RZQ65201.1 fructose-bisphosphate aldolase [Amycolatopsis suaedae]